VAAEVRRRSAARFEQEIRLGGYQFNSRYQLFF
jgi:hypothetical protein